MWGQITAEFGWACAECLQENRKDERDERLIVVAVAEQAELRGIARGLGEAEMAEGVRGQQPSARGALQIAALDQIGLDDVLDGVARLRERGRHGLDADRAAAVVERDGREVAAVHRIEA